MATGSPQNCTGENACILKHNKRVTIWMIRRRYKCHDCGSTFRPELVDLMERSDMEEFGEVCQPVTNGEWFPAIERAKAAIG